MSEFSDGIVKLMPQLRAFARSVTSGNVHLADDIMQDTIVKAIQAEHQFEPGTNLKAWLFTILRNRMYSILNMKEFGNVSLDAELEGGKNTTLLGWLESGDTRTGFTKIDLAETLREIARFPDQANVLLDMLDGMSYEK